MSNLNATTVPNPDTPLAFLPPEAAYQTSVALYVLAGSLGVLIWDVLDNVSADFDLLFRSRIKLNTIAYFGSRIGSLGYTIGSAVFQTAPIGNCPAGETMPDIFYPISLSCSALLFFFRLKAIYAGNHVVIAFFFALWLGVLACTMLIPITVHGAHIGETPYCEDANVTPGAFAAVLAPLVHDTLVFFAISWRLAQNSHIDINFHNGIKVALLGKYLPTFTRSMLLDGQRYYLITLISNLLTVIMAFDTSVPTPMRSMSSTPNIVLTNIMACRVYRNTKNGLIRASEEISTVHTRRQNHGTSAIAFANKMRSSAGQFRSDIPLSEIKTGTAVESSPEVELGPLGRDIMEIKNGGRRSSED